ncbi:MAG: hypothetical protein R2710_24915 [Acidimicrobiales bacterium]
MRSTRTPDSSSTRPTTRAGGGTTRSVSCTTWQPASSWPAAIGVRRPARRILRLRAQPVKQLGHPPFAEALEEGYALDRFEA